MLNKVLQLLLTWKLHNIFADKQLHIAVRNRIFNQRPVLIRHQQQTDWRVIVRGHDFFLIVIDISFKLTYMFMPDLIGFQFDQDMAFQNAVVEYKINKEVLIPDDDPLLFGFKAKTVAQFN